MAWPGEGEKERKPKTPVGVHENARGVWAQAHPSAWENVHGEVRGERSDEVLDEIDHPKAKEKLLRAVDEEYKDLYGEIQSLGVKISEARVDSHQKGVYGFGTYSKNQRDLKRLLSKPELTKEDKGRVKEIYDRMQRYRIDALTAVEEKKSSRGKSAEPAPKEEEAKGSQEGFSEIEEKLRDLEASLNDEAKAVNPLYIRTSPAYKEFQKKAAELREAMKSGDGMSNERRKALEEKLNELIKSKTLVAAQLISFGTPTEDERVPPKIEEKRTEETASRSEGDEKTESPRGERAKLVQNLREERAEYEKAYEAHLRSKTWGDKLKEKIGWKPKGEPPELVAARERFLEARKKRTEFVYKNREEMLARRGTAGIYDPEKFKDARGERLNSMLFNVLILKARERRLEFERSIIGPKKEGIARKALIYWRKVPLTARISLGAIAAGALVGATGGGIAAVAAVGSARLASGFLGVKAGAAAGLAASTLTGVGLAGYVNKAEKGYKQSLEQGKKELTAENIEVLEKEHEAAASRVETTRRNVRIGTTAAGAVAGTAAGVAVGRGSFSGIADAFDPLITDVPEKAVPPREAPQQEPKVEPLPPEPPGTAEPGEVPIVPPSGAPPEPIERPGEIPSPAVPIEPDHGDHQKESTPKAPDEKGYSGLHAFRPDSYPGGPDILTDEPEGFRDKTIIYPEGSKIDKGPGPFPTEPETGKIPPFVFEITGKAGERTLWDASEAYISERFPDVSFNTKQEITKYFIENYLVHHSEVERNMGVTHENNWRVKPGQKIAFPTEAMQWLENAKNHVVAGNDKMEVMPDGTILDAKGNPIREQVIPKAAPTPEMMQPFAPDEETTKEIQKVIREAETAEPRTGDKIPPEVEQRKQNERAVSPPAEPTFEPRIDPHMERQPTFGNEPTFTEVKAGARSNSEIARADAPAPGTEERPITIPPEAVEASLKHDRIEMKKLLEEGLWSKSSYEILKNMTLADIENLVNMPAGARGGMLRDLGLTPNAFGAWLDYMDNAKHFYAPDDRTLTFERFIREAKARALSVQMKETAAVSV